MREYQATRCSFSIHLGQTVDFVESLWFTQFELVGDFYTVRKLWMSSFKCHKWHSILTFVQRDMFRQITTVWLHRTPILDFFLFRKPKFCSTQCNDSWNTLCTHNIQHISTNFTANKHQKFWNINWTTWTEFSASSLPLTVSLFLFPLLVSSIKTHHKHTNTHINIMAALI